MSSSQDLPSLKIKWWASMNRKLNNEINKENKAKKEQENKKTTKSVEKVKIQPKELTE